MRRMRTVSLIVILALATATPARADATAFVGADTTPANRAVRGFALGVGLLVVSFEFEYATTSADDRVDAPALKTGSGNIVLQPPFGLFGFQPYVTAGAGVFRERLGTHTETSVAPNTGGGVKVSLAGPLQLRADYRVFKLGSGALNSPAHSVYAGLNLKL